MLGAMDRGGLEPAAAWPPPGVGEESADGAEPGGWPGVGLGRSAVASTSDAVGEGPTLDSEATGLDGWVEPGANPVVPANPTASTATATTRRTS